ncbi:MAG: UDP-3-O-acyl-N-acetylglucosamine deacetylase [Candidatus Rokuibacteriota bacterium]
MSNQRTIRRSVSTEGVGLHSGEVVKLRLSPAAADTGILLRAPDGTLIPATIDHVVDSHFATTVGAFGVKVRTIEHLMAAAAGLGIDNLLVDVSGGELPAMDGSSKPFVDLLALAGQLTLPAARKPLVIDQTIRVEDGTRWIQVVPAEGFRISYTLDHDHPAIGLQATSFVLSEEVFADEIAPARTYGFLRDMGAMRKNGLGLGGSLDNAVVVGKRTVLNDALRFTDEFVRHKVLDLIGDLLLLGRPLVGHVIARNGGHALNHKLLVAINDARAAERRRTRARGNATATTARSTPESVPAL